MSSILYYSNYCENSKGLLQTISKWGNVQKEMHFINIDKRVKRSNGATYIVLENGQEILLPPTITKVPALLLLNQGHHVLFGGNIFLVAASVKYLPVLISLILKSSVVTNWIISLSFFLSTST